MRRARFQLVAFLICTLGAGQNTAFGVSGSHQVRGAGTKIPRIRKPDYPNGLVIGGVPFESVMSPDLPASMHVHLLQELGRKHPEHRGIIAEYIAAYRGEPHEPTVQPAHVASPAPSGDALPFTYRLPYLRRVGERNDPLWGDDFTANQNTTERPEHVIERLRAFGRTHPEQRQRTATYLRILRKLARHVADREARLQREKASPPDELAFEYELPHLDPSILNTLPKGLPDPMHGFVSGGQTMYMYGQDMSKKAPHIHIAALKSWAILHPEGKAVADAYSAIFVRAAEKLYARDREVRQADDKITYDRVELRISDSVLLRKREREHGLPVPSDEWDAHSHDPAWVREHLPKVDYLAKKGVSNPHMSAFEKLVARIGAGEQLPLAGFRIMGLQHLVSNTGSFIRALANAGVAPKDISMMGKVYSQNDAVIDELRQDGFDMHKAQFESAMDVAFDEGGMAMSGGKHNREVELDQMVAKIVRQTMNPSHELDEARSFFDRNHKYVVVDDGGELIEHIHLHYPALHDRIVAVEQTRKGIRRLQHLNLQFPVINMAEAGAKLELESPMIGRALALSTMKRLDRIRKAGIEVKKKILLVGYGDIGARAAASLRREGYEVSVIDQSADAMRRAAADGYPVWNEPAHEGITPLQKALSEASVVLSITGTTAITPADLEHAPSGTIFLNGASSATEFMPFVEDLTAYQNRPHREGSSLVTTVAGKRFEMGKVMHGGDPQLDFVLRTRSGKEHILVARGQVINFDNGVGVLPPRYAQLIVGLLYMSTMQAARTTQPGIHALDATMQQEYVRDIQAELATTKESLEDAHF